MHMRVRGVEFASLFCLDVETIPTVWYFLFSFYFYYYFIFWYGVHIYYLKDICRPTLLYDNTTINIYNLPVFTYIEYE